MEQASRSREALLDFLDYLARKGLLNKTTANARKAAVGKVLSLLDVSEASDISSVDIDNLMHRFSNLYGSEYTPGSLNTYKSRIKSSVEDFLNYQQNPMTFKIGGASGSKRTGDKPKSATGTVEKRPVHMAAVSAVPPPASVTVLPIPIRANLTVQIQGIPYDLTTAEANKIANVIRAMAESD